MNLPHVSDIVEILAGIAPPALAEEWDSTSLQLGDPRRIVERIMVALDPDDRVVDQAIATRSSLLVTHHPLIFKPLPRLVTTDPLASLIIRAVSADLAIFSMHTNFDSVDGGLNDLLAQAVGVLDTEVLIPSPPRFLKLVVFIPVEHEERVRCALSPLAAPIGQYRDCTFRTTGDGTFRPLVGASPFIGTVGSLEEVNEVRLELLIERERTSYVLKTLREVHPYEEPAYDLYPVEQADTHNGLGRIGRLPQPITLGEYAEQVSATLGGPVRLYGARERRVARVALCSGSGASLIGTAAARGADLLLTGDIRHHDAHEARMRGLSLIDASHFATERLMVPSVAGRLRESLAARNYRVDVLEADETRPWTDIHPTWNNTV
ncbi:MAG: Nif3-like dinuclear metal center hexameric protein [Desulfuromonadia bacterium]